MNYMFLNSLPRTPETRCAYYPRRQSSARAFRCDDDLPDELLEFLLNRGYRRCGDVYYSQECSGCSRCLSYRIRTADFRVTRSQRRFWKRNQDVEVRVVSPRATPVKEDLYLRYQYEQHHLKDLERGTQEPCQDFDPDRLLDTMYYQMYTHPSSSRELEMWLDGELIGFGIMDVTRNSVSAVYFVFDPRRRDRSLGTFNILAGLDWATRQERDFFHMGFLILEHPKMDYKRKFGPGEILNRSTGEWNRALLDGAITV